MKVTKQSLLSVVPSIALGLMTQAAAAQSAPAAADAPAAAATSAATPAPAAAAASKRKKDGFTVSGSVYVGASYRTTDRDPGLIPAPNGAAVGDVTNAPGGKNQDDGDLNYGKWQPVSTPLKGLIEASYAQGDYGIVGSAQGWYDYTQKKGDVPWGNVTNDFAANQPLSDDGFAARSKFANIVLDELYVYGDNRIGTHDFDWKLGQQRLDWGSKFQMRGGLNDISPDDLPAKRRPGALPDEGRIPVLASTAQFGLTQTTAINGFLQFHFEPNAPMGCGTFYSQSDFVSEGCNKVFAGKGSDRASLAAGQYITRAATQDSDSLQGGIGLTQKLPGIGSELGLYYAQIHSRKAYYGGIKSGRDASQAPFIPGNADGENPQYFTEYPDDIRIAGLTFNKKLAHGAVMAELTYRPNQPFQYNAIDELQAFLSPTAATPLRDKVDALPPGAALHGFERHKALQFNLGGVQNLPGILGAQSGQIGAELAYKWADLPPVDEIRFGRPDAFGSAPVDGAPCPAGSSAKTCSTDGYVSRNSFGYRLRAGLRYANGTGTITFTPSVLYGQDVVGWSEDSTFSEGRQFVVASLKTEIQKAYQIELAYQPIWGGSYDNLRDRDTLSLSLGYRF